MKLALLPCVYDIINEVERLTKKKFSFIESDKLQAFAGIKLARKNMETHILMYKKEHDQLINHLIAHECGHALRMFAVPEYKRLIPYTNDKIKKGAFEEIEHDITRLSRHLEFNMLVKVLNMWYEGLIRQLTNYPSDIEIEKWLYNDYPDLRQFQLQSIKKQRNEAIKGLSDEVRSLTPLKIFDSSNIMNYSFFRVLGLMMGDNFITPFSSHPNYIREGKTLITIYEKFEVKNYEGDISVVNAWSEYLNLTNWYKWSDFENIPDNYLNAN